MARAGGRKVLLFEQQERESNKAFAAFKTYLELGTDRSLVSVADKLGKSRTLIERWSKKYDWPARVQAHGQHLADIERRAAEAVVTVSGVDWGRRQVEHREEEWSLRGELIAAGRKVLEKFKEGSRGATLGDVARALDLASKLGRLSSGLPNEVKEVKETVTGRLEIEWELALRKIYGGPEGATVDAEVVESKLLSPGTEGKG